MIKLLRKYLAKSVDHGNTAATGIAIFAQDDELLCCGTQQLGVKCQHIVDTFQCHSIAGTNIQVVRR
jgi:hypothetical protein